MEEGLEVAREDNKPVVTEDDIAEVVSMWTGIPVARIASEESQRLLQMEDALHGRVIGQDEAITAIAKSVRRSRAGLKDPKRPIGVFMFLGPTGVGKTYLPRVLSEFMFGSEDNMIKLDMSEFMEKHNVSRLVGAPPGYIGYDDGGQLTDTVRRKSYCLILLDEIEKAHPDVFNMLLQIFDDGHLTDAKGRKVDFRNTIIIMTSNVGSDLIRRDSAIGFQVTKDEAKTAEQQHGKMKDKVLEELKRVFRPEFLNRIDSQVVFHTLSKPDIRKIVDLQLRDLEKQLLLKGVSLEMTHGGEGLARREGLRPRVRRAAAAPRDPERARGPAVGGAAAGALRHRRHGADRRAGRRPRADDEGRRAGGARAHVTRRTTKIRQEAPRSSRGFFVT